MLKKFVYLTSSSYSGSTLLATMMDTHPEVASIGELSDLERVRDWKDYHCSCGKKFLECEFWDKFTERTQQDKGVDFSNIKTKLYPGIMPFLDRLSLHYFSSNCLNNLNRSSIMKLPAYKRHFLKVNQDYIDYAKIILDLMQKSVFLDSSKNPKRIFFLKKLLGDKLKVIHLIKDGRGVLDSFLRYKPNLTEEEIIKRWIRANNRIEYEKTLLSPENVITINYDALTNDTENVIEKIFNFLGLKYNDQFKRFNEIEHHILGNNKMRMSRKSEIKKDEKWKKSLNKEQLNLFDAIGGFMNQKYELS